jgi:hypothetical protein
MTKWPGSCVAGFLSAGLLCGGALVAAGFLCGALRPAGARRCQLPVGWAEARPVIFSLISHSFRAAASSRAAADGSRRRRLT